MLCFRALEVANYYIAANSEISVKLRKELQNSGMAGSSQKLEWNKLESLPYLNGVVHEAMRLAHGVSTRSPRLAPDQELRYGKYVIPKNTPVSMSAVDILMNDKIYPDPKAFKPERWIKNPELEKYFVPFGRGGRQCLGIKQVSLNVIQAHHANYTPQFGTGGIVYCNGQGFLNV